MVAKILALVALLALSVNAATSCKTRQCFPLSTALGINHPCLQHLMLRQAFTIGISPSSAVIMQQPLAFLQQQLLPTLQQLQLLSILPYVINTLATANSTAYGQQVLPYAFSSLAMACPFAYRQQYLINALATVNPVAYVPYALNTLAAVNPVIFNELATTNPVIFNALATTNPTIFNALATANPVIFRQQFFTGDA